MSRQKYVPMEKQSKKARKAANAARRTGWDEVVPVTRVIPDKRKAKLERIRQVSCDE